MCIRDSGTPVYDFTITDRIFDALVEAHVRPLVEIGFMPEALSTHPEPYRHTFPKGDIFTGWTYPPKDEAKWSALVKAYAEHLKERYGKQVDFWPVSYTHLDVYKRQPPTPWSRTRCSTRLSHSPNKGGRNTQNGARPGA